MDRRLLAERGLELRGIEPGDRVGVERAEPLLHLQRPRERRRVPSPAGRARSR